MAEITSYFVEELATGDCFIYPPDGETYEVIGIHDNGGGVTLDVECLTSTDGEYDIFFEYGDTVNVES